MKLVLIFIVVFAVGSTKDIYRRISIQHHEDNPNAYHPRIIGGELVKGREFPGQVSLLLGGHHHCGASIINENYILTAAHCDPTFSKNNSPEGKLFDLIALSGTNSLINGGTQHEVIEIHRHEGFKPIEPWHNDIAVMKVNPPFRFGEDTKPVSLPAQGQNPADGSSAIMIGWGATENDSKSDNLLKVNLQILNLDDCRNIYEQDGIDLIPEQICATSLQDLSGPCSGDSGGPLIVYGQVLGLYSFEHGCAEVGWPGVYTRVSSYRDWIDSIIV